MHRLPKITSLLYSAAFILWHSLTASTFAMADSLDDFTAPTSAEIQQRVSEINAAIQDKGGKWVAGETSMSVLSPPNAGCALAPLLYHDLSQGKRRWPRNQRSRCRHSPLPPHLTVYSIGGVTLSAPAPSPYPTATMLLRYETRAVAARAGLSAHSRT